MGYVTFSQTTCHISLPFKNLLPESHGLLGMTSHSFSGQDGGALVMMGLSQASMTASTFQANQAAQHGGAISARNCRSVLLDGSAFRNNTAGGLGGGLLCRSCLAATIKGNCIFEDGQAASGAGVALVGTESGTQQERGTEAAAEREAALHIEDTHFRNHRTLVQQQAVKAAASGMPFGNLRHLLQKGGSFINNEQSPRGRISATAWQTGFLAVGSSSGQLSCSTSGAGGALCAELDGAMRLKRVRLSNNTARFGGEVELQKWCN
jgi:predicted outer membrane repeat protein